MENSISESSVSARNHLLLNDRVSANLGDNNLEHLKRELNNIYWDDLNQAMEDVRGILQSYHSNKDDWKTFCKRKQEEGYSRNEIITVPNKYTLMLMVWKPLKGNFIHDHCGSHGVVKILQGRLVEEHYSYHKEKKKGKRLKKEKEITLECNEVNDHKCFKDFHRMYNPDPYEVAVSLHVYAPPLERCRIINKKSNVTEVVQMKYASTKGEMNTKTEMNKLSEYASESLEDESPSVEYDYNPILTDIIQKLHELNWKKIKSDDPRDIRKLLKRYDTNHCDWIKYCKIWDDEEYSRTIIHKSSEFTLSLNYYRKEADSLPHDHHGARCIFKVLEGTLEETHFKMDTFNKKLYVDGKPKIYVKNQVNKIQGCNDYHSNRNPSNKDPAITLNVFTSSDVKCRVFEPESKSAYDIGPNFHTPDGLRRRRPESKAVPKRPDQEDVKPLIPKSGKKSHQYDKKGAIIQTALRIAPLWLSSIALILALAVLVIWSIEMRPIETTHDFQPGVEVEQYSKFCFKCSLIGDYPDHHPKSNLLLEMLNNLTRHKIDDHNSECCVENDEQFKALVAFLSSSLITEQGVKLPNKLPPTTPVSAHKYLLPEQHSTDKKFGEHFPLTFNTSSHDPSYEHVRGVDVTKDGFIVQVTGIYYVYSSIKFKREPATDKTLYHYLHRISFNNQIQTGVLLRSVHTICQDCVRSQETSFAGGIFYLQSGDKLQVCVSVPGVVDEQREAMYMGLAMLKS